MAIRKTASSRALKPKLINLALQGGGAHGAYTWGVLDQLLEDGRVVIEAISGTSAGAMNAAVLASACLPLVFQAVEIDGDPYWDGGYMGNPALYPLIYNCTSRDIIIVQINPLERVEPPRTAREILNRMNEITFNSSLLRELRAIDFVTRLIEEGHLKDTHYKRMLIHRIDAEDELKPLSASSKMNAEWRFLKHLHDIGKTAAELWLDRHYDRLGEDSTVDIRALITTHLI